MSATSSEIQSFRDMAQRFAKKELEPVAVDIDNYPFKEFNRGAVEKARENGLLTVLLPEEHGGVGQGMEALCAILHELAKADGSFAAIVFVNALALSAMHKWGKNALLESYAAGSLVGFPAYDLPTELQGDVKAEPCGGGHKLSGVAEYISLAPVADAFIVPASIGGKLGLFAVDAKAKGVSLSEPVISLGLRGCPAADVELLGVEVGADDALTLDAADQYPALAASFRCAAGAMAVGVAEGSYESAKAYAKDRYQGGRMIIDYDMVRQMLVNMAVVVESGKALVTSMAQAADGERPWPVSDAGLVLLSEQAARTTTDGVQCLGGYGYMEDYGQEKRMRDAKQIENIFGPSPLKRLCLMEDILRQEE